MLISCATALMQINAIHWGAGIKWVVSGILLGVPAQCRRPIVRVIIATFAVLAGLSNVAIEAALN